MRELSIGDVARRAGLRASAVRFYEKSGLLPAPPRKSRQRRYSEAVLGRLHLIKLAQEAGFTLAETRTFLSGFPGETPPAKRWRTLAERKLKELDALETRIRQMRLLLETGFHCSCPRVEDCEKYLQTYAS
jgi:MerR family redox-sensitive transcriptional activator SoxR